MKKEELLVFSAVILIIFSLIYRNLMSNVPFNLFNVKKLDELALIEYDKNVSDELNFKLFSSTERICNLTVCNKNISIKLIKGFNYFEENVSDCKDTYTKVVCESSSVSFHFLKTTEEAIEKNNEFINIKKFVVNTNGPELTIKVEGNYTAKNGGYKLVNFYLDDKLVRSPQYFFQPLENNFSIEEKFLLQPGNHSIRVEIDDKKLEKNIFIPYTNGIVVNYLLLLFSILFALYSKVKFKINWMWFSLIFLTIFFFLLPINFQLSKNLNFPYGIVIVLLPLLLFLKKSKFRFVNQKMRGALVFSIITTTILILIKILVGDAIPTTHYYLRQLELTYLYGNTNYFDSLSYLGRKFNYPSQGFLMLTSTIAKMLTVSPKMIISYFHNVLIFLFTFTLYIVTEKIKNWKNRILICGTILINYFIFTLILASPLHTLAFLLLNLSVIFYKRSKWLSAINLATGMWTHLTMLLVFPFYVYAAYDFRINIKEILRIILLGICVSLIFYLPFIIKNGMITEAVPTERGFLQSYGILGAIGYFSFVLIFIILVIALGFYKSTKPTLVFIIMLLIYLFISHRAVILSLFILPFLFVKILDRELKYTPFYLICLLIIILSFLHTLLVYSGTTEWCKMGVVNENCIEPMRFINRYTSTKDSVALNPLFGHLETYYGKRKVLADVFVEYANQEKYLAEQRFYQSCNLSTLKKYNITLVMLDNIDKIRKLENGDKIYDNGFFHIYRIK